MRNLSPAPSTGIAQSDRIGVLVLGMHRSGTSAVAGVLDLLGVPTPGELLPPAEDNEKGFFENKAVYEFHERLLAALGSSWDDTLPLSNDFVDTPYGTGLAAELAELIERELAQKSPIFAVKDPRLSRFIPLWRVALSQAGVTPIAVIPLRHPVEVAGSLGKRNGFPRAKTFLIWLDHMLAIEADTRGMVRSFVGYDELLRDWRTATDRLSRDLSLQWPKKRDRIEHKIDAFLDSGLRHHKQAAELGSETRLDTIVSQAWDAFSALVSDANDQTVFQSLDAIRAEVRDAAQVFSGYLNWMREEQAAKDTKIHHLNLAERDLRQEKDTEIHRLNLAEALLRREKDAEIGQLNSIAQDLRRELAGAEQAASEERAGLERSLTESFERELGERNEAIYRLDDDMRALRKEKDEAQALVGVVDRLEHEVGHVRRENDHLRTLINAIHGSTTWRALRPVHRVAERLPNSFKVWLRRGAKAGWWAITPWRTRERLRFLRTRNSQHLLLQAPPNQAPGPALDFPPGAFVPHGLRSYDAWVRRYDTLKPHHRAAIRGKAKALNHKPLISIVMPVYDTPETVLREAIGSVRAQLYDNWELCIADDASPAPHVNAVLTELAAAEPRIKWMRRDTNGHIAAASNSALELARGEFIALMDHDDLLPEHALFEIVTLLNERPDADIVFSDEDKVDENGTRSDPYFKPGFSLDLFLGQNLINHLGVYRASLIDEVGGFRSGVDGSQDYDLALRVIARTSPEKILHIPKVLYHWRQPSGTVSFSQSALDKCIASSRKAIQDYLDETHQGSDDKPRVEACPLVPSWNRVRWPVPTPAPLVSVIIPTRDYAQLLKQCVEGLLHRTDYANIEILVVDNGSVEQRTRDLFASWAGESRIRILPDPRPFNYSRLNNFAAKEAKGDLFLLLNNDIDVIGPDWLTEMVSLASRPGIGIVGAKLLYGDRRVQHAGVRLGAGTFDGGPGVAGHFGHLAAAQDAGYRGSYALTQEMSAVTAACLLVTRQAFEAVEGLDEESLTVAFNDIDFCLRVREAGFRVLWTPYAELFHLESASRGSDMTPEKQERFGREARYMRSRWGALLDRDPFYNQNFDNTAPDYVLDFTALPR